MESKITKEFFSGSNLHATFPEKIKLACYAGNLV